ncbi:ABC transporter ATP-binding protein [Cellulosilyticum sp. I15G10I2]|uniref:ABC transporter ATP-binding protein n=1 Tax=Cellulosilyticum sp. I15G10I2 TaxID=1892843 RepID=UPI002E8DEED5|nr:ABC transporter ATP-binding protein [Cellulosilyticum sp. I15G10I2]
MKRFIHYYKPYKGLFFTDMFCALTLSGIDLVFPLLVRFLMNEVYVIPDMNQIIKYVAWIGFLLFVMYVIRYFCQYFITSWGHIMGAKMETDMRSDLFGHLEKLSFSYYDETNTGKLMSRIVNDLFDISELAHHGPEDLFVSMIKITGTFIILSLINIKLTLILIFFTGIMLYFSYFYNKKMRITFRKNREKIAAVNAIAQDALGGIRVVKSFANEKIEMEKFEAGNTAFLETKCESYRVMGKYFSGNGFFQGILYLTVVLAGGIFISQNELTVVDLTIYILYINTFLNPIEKLVNFTEQFQKGITGFERFLEVMDTQPEIEDDEGAKPISGVKGDIVFDNVSFSYNEKQDVLTDLNIEIKAGSTIALVGPSGGGKTTFCSLIPRFYEVSSGTIRIDEQDIKKLTQRSLRDAIGIVQQDVYLFAGSIKENIAYGKPDAEDGEIIAAAQKANIHDFIMTLPKGYDTYVGERGVKLSGGQKQRLAIARVFLKNPPILILDEATSALDNESEKFIQRSLEELAKNRTTLVIAHRLSTIKNADEIIVLTEEGIKEKGKHEELLEKGGIYAYLYNMQFEV